MVLPNNYLKYPDNVYKPFEKKIGDTTYTIHSFLFRGLQDFYDFLKDDPAVNTTIWKNKSDLASVTNGFDFAGVPYEDALEKLISETDPGYQEYLQVQKNIKAKSARSHKYKEIKTIAGGMVDPVSYTVGSPEIYRASRITKKPKFITIDTQVAYNWTTEKSQVFNRALIITNLIRALERNGYSVDVNSFMIASNVSEIIQAVFQIKKHGQKINYQALYKSLVDVEFFRRLCFRLMEVSDVETYWSSGYGRTESPYMVRKLLNLKKEDIYFDQPSNMGIYGYDIEKDFEKVIKKLHLENSIDIEREKEMLSRGITMIKR